MCWFGGDDYKPGTGAPAIKPSISTDTTLPSASEIIAEGDAATAEFGATKKESGQAAGNRGGAESLRIGLNTGAQGGTGPNTGGGQMV